MDPACPRRHAEFRCVRIPPANENRIAQGACFSVRIPGGQPIAGEEPTAVDFRPAIKRQGQGQFICETGQVTASAGRIDIARRVHEVRCREPAKRIDPAATLEFYLFGGIPAQDKGVVRVAGNIDGAVHGEPACPIYDECFRRAVLGVETVQGA